MREIDPKYSIRIEPTSCGGPEALAPFAGVLNQLLASLTSSIVKTATGEPIPDDEPLILFRSRDRLALPMLEYYLELALEDGCTDFHIEGIKNRIGAFRAFRDTHTDRMKQPGITKGL